MDRQMDKQKDKQTHRQLIDRRTDKCRCEHTNNRQLDISKSGQMDRLTAALTDRWTNK
jgi:hypothetical protein